MYVHIKHNHVKKFSLGLHIYVGKIIVKPWSKSKSGPLPQQAPKLNKSTQNKEKRRMWTKG